MIVTCRLKRHFIPPSGANDREIITEINADPVKVHDGVVTAIKK